MEDQQRVAIETLYKAVICNITTRYCTKIYVGGRNARRGESQKRGSLAIEKGGKKKKYCTKNNQC